jgi:hypothetical protein
MPSSMTIRTLAIPSVLLFCAAILSVRSINDREYVKRLGQITFPTGGSWNVQDVNGQSVALQSPSSDRYVAAVLNGSDTRREISYWREVQQSLPARTALIGLCEGEHCAEVFRHEEPASFPIGEFGSYHSVVALTEQDRAGRVAILGAGGTVLSSVPKRSSPQALAALLRSKIDATRH